MQDYADAKRRAVEAGYEWVELHFAHGYLGSEFFSPIQPAHRPYGGSRKTAHDSTSRFSTLSAHSPRGIPLTMRLGIDDLNPGGAGRGVDHGMGWMKEHGLDLADVSIGVNTYQMQGKNPLATRGYMVENANRVRDRSRYPGGHELEPGPTRICQQVSRPSSST